MKIPEDMRRLLVIGTSCSGKTTMASSRSVILSCRHVELDRLYWLPGWRNREVEEFRELTRREVSGSCWVVDGNYSFVRDITLSRATAVIWLNYSFPRVFWRALRRTTQRVYSQDELFAGNRESFRQSFLSKDSILWWVITTWRRRKREYARLAKHPHHPPFVKLCHPRDAEIFLDKLQERDWKPCEEQE